MTKWRRVGVGVGVGVALISVAGGWVAALWDLRTPQHLLVDWVFGSLVVGAVLLVGGARAAGAALVGSSVLSFLAYLLRGYYGGDHLETLVYGAVILGSVGLIGFGLVGVASGSHTPPGSIPRGAGPCNRHRYRRDVADPPDPLGGGNRLHRPAGYLLAPPRTREHVLATRVVMLPRVRRALGPDVACVQRRLPRGAVPGASVASVAVIGGAQRGRPPRGLVGQSFLWRRAAVLAFALGPFSAKPKRQRQASRQRPSLPTRARSKRDVGGAGGRLGVSVAEYRELEAGERVLSFETLGPGSASCTSGRRRSCQFCSGRC
jgi:hypothetical protein